jgi:hypothetical protein
MSFYPYTSYLTGASEKHRKIERKRQELLERRMESAVKKAKDSPSLKNINEMVEEYALIAATHEELALRQMQKAIDSGDSENFWKNQKRFLQFIDLESSDALSEKANLGYKCGHAWFLKNNPCFSMRFLNISPEQLREYRRNNWREYNRLCTERNEEEKRYCRGCFSSLVFIPTL